MNKEIILNKINRIVEDYEMRNDLIDIIEDFIISKDCIVDWEDEIEEIIDSYVSEEDEMIMGCINLWSKIEERDWVINRFKEYKILD